MAMVLIPGIAYLVRNWRILQLVLVSPALLVGLYFWSAASWIIIQYSNQPVKNNGLNVRVFFFFGYTFRLLPESARWLLSQGRKEEVRKALQRAARINGRKIPETLLAEVSSLRQDSFLNTLKSQITHDCCVLYSWRWRVPKRQITCFTSSRYRI